MFPIAQEVRRIAILAALGCVVVTGAFGVAAAVPLWLLLGLFIFFFRDFPRDIPSIPLANVSPVDGTVVSVSQTSDPFLDRDALLVRIQQNWFGEFNLHGPNEGKVQNKWYPADRTGNRKLAIWIKTDEGDDVVLAVDVSGILQYVRFKIRSGERVGQGQRCGMALFGRPVDVYLPVGSCVEVSEGQRLKAGSDIIAKFVRKRA